MRDRKEAYTVLGLPDGAGRDEIEKKYMVLVRRYRRLAADETPSAAEPLFDRINEAYNLLTGYKPLRAPVFKELRPAEKAAHLYEHYRFEALFFLFMLVFVWMAYAGIRDIYHALHANAGQAKGEEIVLRGPQGYDGRKDDKNARSVTHMEQVQVGQPVPDFTLPATTGKEVALSDYRGKKLVIYFYPKDMTPGCTQESCDFRDYTPQFKQAGAEVIGISPDDLKSHGKFIEKHGLPFTLLSDTEHTVSELFGVWKLKKMMGREFMGVERSTFLIDEEGKLAREWRKVKVENHAAEVLQAVKEL